jgi:hypothetical protein
MKVINIDFEKSFFRTWNLMIKIVSNYWIDKKIKKSIKWHHQQNILRKLFKLDCRNCESILIKILKFSIKLFTKICKICIHYSRYNFIWRQRKTNLKFIIYNNLLNRNLKIIKLCSQSIQNYSELVFWIWKVSN